MGNNLQYYSSLDLTDYKSERKLGWRQRTRTLNPASASSVRPSKALDLPAPPILNLKTEYVELAVILRFFRGILLNNSMFDLFFSENKNKMGVKLPINCISIYEFWLIPWLHRPELALKTKAGLSRWAGVILGGGSAGCRWLTAESLTSGAGCWLVTDTSSQGKSSYQSMQRYKDSALLPQFGTTLKDNPRSRAPQGLK